MQTLSKIKEKDNCFQILHVDSVGAGSENGRPEGGEAQNLIDRNGVKGDQRPCA